MLKTPELLAPLNDWKTLSPKLKVLDNADSVYFGIDSKFSMRARAGNFRLEDLPRLSKQVHDHGDRLYLCTNIVVYNDEIHDLQEILEKAYTNEVDSVIVYDFSSIHLAKEIGLDFHISTQMNISNILSAKYFESMGASRINLARELNLHQIKEIIANMALPVECFVHGAMCTAVSGRCYLSAEMMGKSYSANRGKCAHQCRRFYTFTGEDGEILDYEPATGRFFNAKDLCMIEHIDTLIDAEISAFKIEGRMRDPLYISETTACYREAIQSVSDGTYSDLLKGKWMKRLSIIYNRGFHVGFYFSIPNQNDIELQAKGNTSFWKRKMLGLITEYSHDDSLATVEITSGNLSLGDKVIIQNKSGFYTTFKIDTLLAVGKSVESSQIGSSEKHVFVSFPVDEIIPVQAKVFKLHQVEDPVKE